MEKRFFGFETGRIATADVSSKLLRRVNAELRRFKSPLIANDSANRSPFMGEVGNFQRTEDDKKSIRLIIAKQKSKNQS